MVQKLNHLTRSELRDALSKCCGSQRWVEKMCAAFPVKDEAGLFTTAREKWYECSRQDWLEAFAHHPKIGDVRSFRETVPDTALWAEDEQAAARTAPSKILEKLSEGNKAYEKKFGYIFIVCASGKPADEMLQILESRLPNSPDDEIKISMEEQHKITRLRLQKLLES